MVSASSPSLPPHEVPHPQPQVPHGGVAVVLDNHRLLQTPSSRSSGGSCSGTPLADTLDASDRSSSSLQACGSAYVTLGSHM
jgi:hypothetical protein